MIVFTVAVHVGGIVALTVWLRTRFLPLLGPETFSTLLAMRLIVVTVFGAFFLHAIEVWSWAYLYLLLGQFESLERSLYFSTVTFTTLGYGDITLEPRWQLLSGLEAVNGVVLLDVMTAVVFAVLLRIF
ncbi:MAG: ion channel [Hyphomicrobiaceae bacterium]